jgi:hypothetical protein
MGLGPYERWVAVSFVCKRAREPTPSLQRAMVGNYEWPLGKLSGFLRSGGDAELRSTRLNVCDLFLKDPRPGDDERYFAGSVLHAIMVSMVLS